MEEYIIINRIKCAHCGEILVSNNRHDFKFCSCKTVAVDGGNTYLRPITLFGDKFEDYLYGDWKRQETDWESQYYR